MKKICITLGLVCLLASPALALELTSPQLRDGGSLPAEQVFNGFGCTGPNISPALNWSKAPAGTKSFALTVHDPDAPTSSGWWHWLVLDIPPNVMALEGGASGKGLPAPLLEGLTDFGKPGFGGACPPKGDKPHRYVFTLYALDIKSLGLDAKAMPALVSFMINQHTIEKATLTVTYQR